MEIAVDNEALYLIVAILLLIVAAYTVYFAVKAVFSLIISIVKLVFAAAAILGVIYGFPLIIAFLQQLKNSPPASN